MQKVNAEHLPLWEILVPTHLNGNKIPVERHKEWDRHVAKTTGGLTVFSTVKGRWTDEEGVDVVERMIPVRIACDSSKMEVVADLTAEFYAQKAIIYYSIAMATIRTYSD